MGTSVPQGLPPFTALVQLVAVRFQQDRCLQVASSLTFTTLLSLVPLVTVALTLVSAFPVFRELSDAVQRFVLEHLVPTAASAFAAKTEQFAANAAHLTLLGMVFLVATSIMLLMTIERAFNDIWRVSRPRTLFQRVLIYWTLLTVGPILVGASISLTSWLVSVSLGLVSDIPGAGGALLKTVPILLTAGALALLYGTMPNRRVRLRDALIGGLLAGLTFEMMKRGFAWYVAQFPTYKLVYGAFASVPLFLLWVYLSWFVVLCGAVLVAALPEWRTRSAGAPHVPGSDFFNALDILRVLFEAHRSGRVVRLPELHRAVAAPVERIESLLEAMVGAMWVSRTLPLGWVLNRDPATIKVSEVYRNFVFRGEVPAVATSENAGDGRIAEKILSAIEESSSISLEQFFGAEGAGPKQSPVAPQTT